MYEAGLATHYVPHGLLEAVQEALHTLGPSRAADFAEVARTLDTVQGSGGPCPQGARTNMTVALLSLTSCFLYGLRFASTCHQSSVWPTGCAFASSF